MTEVLRAAFEAAQKPKTTEYMNRLLGITPDDNDEKED